jgi:(1->4)-alpha-D-glucan 1-alpha-D-glucosylmutase
MWPLERSAEKHLPSRIENFVIKASREAKTFTRWTRPDEEYERALVEFAQALVKRRRFGWFSEFIELQQYLSHFGAINALSQLVLKTMSPGVPDFYQGTEIWNFSVVDPDNRRPVDYPKRMKMLADLEGLGDAPDLLKNWQDGRVKLFVTRALLQLRRVNGGLFRDGGYEPLRARGDRARHIVGFTRAHEGDAVVVAVPRFSTQLVSPPKFPLGKRVWGDTRVQAPAGELVSVFTGARLEAERGSFRAADLFEDFPVFVGVAI